MAQSEPELAVPTDRDAEEGMEEGKVLFIVVTFGEQYFCHKMFIEEDGEPKMGETYGGDSDEEK